MAKIIDSDAHVVEPRALWEEYVEPAFRDRIPRVVKDADGVDRFAVGQAARAGIYAPAAMCIPGGLSRPELASQLSWDDLRPGSYDPHARIQDMDSEGIDVSFLFPSLALAYVAIREADLAAAACGAYNNWMADFCGAYPERLYSIAPVPLFEVDAAIAEMRRVVKEHGVRAVLVRPNPYGGRLLSDPAYDPFWREAQELDCTIAVHGAVGGDMPTAGFDRYRDFFQRMIISHPLEQQMACMTLICGGVLEKYPRLRVAFLEAGGLWAPYWLARLDEFHGKIGHMAPRIKLKPSEYFRRQCFCSCEPDDVALKTVAALDAGDFLMWASDYPHYDCEFPGAVRELREHCAALGPETQRKIMGENAARCYGLG
ncbi:MAG TPA: amidohydrolase family protein [Candidatus Binataceae bacterium]|nr:amidohydrolase family protein [Candidatus Binataceae bacterium]